MKEITLTGTIQNKQFISLDEVIRLVFALVAKNEDGKQISIECHAWGMTARQLDLILTDGAVARVKLAKQKNTPEKFAARRVVSAELLQLPKREEEQQQPAPPRPTAWGLWRNGQRWYRALTKQKEKVVFIEDCAKAQHFNSFIACQGRQLTLKQAFGIQTQIKPIN